MQTGIQLSAPRKTVSFAPIFARMLVVVSIFAGSQAHANFYCVSTATQLQNALDDASDGGMYSTETNLIYVVKGTYNIGAATGNLPFHFLSTQSLGSVILYGGYNATCATQTLDPSLTVLDGQNSKTVFVVATTRSFEMDWFTIQNGNDTQGNSSGGIQVIAAGGSAGAVFVSHNIIRNNHTPTHNGGVYMRAEPNYSVSLYSNLIVGNSADQGFGAGTILDNGSVGGIIHNTIVHNTTSMSNTTGGLYYGGSASNYFIDENIFWTNTFSGLQTSTTNVSLEYNDIGNRTGPTPGIVNVGNVSITPLFIDDAGGDFHLSGASALLASHPSHTALLDVEGHRFQGNGQGDVGAYAETIFADPL